MEITLTVKIFVARTNLRDRKTAFSKKTVSHVIRAAARSAGSQSLFHGGYVRMDFFSGNIFHFVAGYDHQSLPGQKRKAVGFDGLDHAGDGELGFVGP